MDISLLEENELYRADDHYYYSYFDIFERVYMLYVLLKELRYNKFNRILTESKEFPQRAKIFNVQGLVVMNTLTYPYVGSAGIWVSKIFQTIRTRVSLGKIKSRIFFV